MLHMLGLVSKMCLQDTDYIKNYFTLLPPVVQRLTPQPMNTMLCSLTNPLPTCADLTRPSKHIDTVKII